MIITGAGPGIMEGGNVGAGAKRSFGANIRLPMEVPSNEIVEGDPKLINFKYFYPQSNSSQGVGHRRSFSGRIGSCPR